MPAGGLFEAVPNFSEGRDKEKIERIVASVRAVPGASVLDLHSDPDHNRSVLTFAGGEGPLLEASVALARACAREIDLSGQTGVHPRIGALDVLPFVPLSGATLDAAADLARRVAEGIGASGIPVYLYEHAAPPTASHRRALPDLRRGGLEALTVRALENPSWRPDYGPGRLSPRTGAVAVGARRLLVAFNAYLDTPDVGVARVVASAVRERDGGLPGLRALGLGVGGRAQVSMNLADLEKTSLPAALEAVRRAALENGARVESTELVGMAPLSALLEAARHHLALPRLGPEDVLEAALWASSPNDLGESTP